MMPTLWILLKRSSSLTFADLEPSLSRDRPCLYSSVRSCTQKCIPVLKMYMSKKDSSFICWVLLLMKILCHSDLDEPSCVMVLNTVLYYVCDCRKLRASPLTFVLLSVVTLLPLSFVGKVLRNGI